MRTSCRHAGLPNIASKAGVVTSAELLAAGLSRAQIRYLVARRELVLLSRGVFVPVALAVGAAPNRAHALRLAAALAVTGPKSAGSHRTAAAIHGLDLLGRGTAYVEVTRPPGGGSRTGRPGVHVHSAALPAAHVAARDDVRVTSVARTVVDLARTLSFPAGVVAADSALRARKTSRRQLESVITACAGWPGIRQARQVVSFSDGRSESVLESISRVAFKAYGLPPPDLQAWVGNDVVIGRADFLWRTYRTIGEADGAIKYATPSRAIAQLQRDARLRAAGFQVVHFTWDEIVHDPGQVIAAIKTAFSLGGAPQTTLDTIPRATVAVHDSSSRVW